VCLLQDLNPAYNMLLRSELLGCHCPSPISPDKATQLEQLRGTASPGKKILCFKSGKLWYMCCSYQFISAAGGVLWAAEGHGQPGQEHPVLQIRYAVVLVLQHWALCCGQCLCCSSRGL
jgi:hypothetical protein